MPEVLKFMEGKTTLMVTHRPSLLRHVDKVIHIQKGRIAYDGPPDGFDIQAFSTRKTLAGS